MLETPHKDKIEAAILNPKCSSEDKEILKQALKDYSAWISKTIALSSTGKKRVDEMTKLLNEYKDFLELELISENTDKSRLFEFMETLGVKKEDVFEKGYITQFLQEGNSPYLKWIKN